MKTFGQKAADEVYTDREGVYLVCFQQDKLAVVRTKRGLFLPGGGIEGNESREECLCRELLEETGYAVLQLSYACSADIYTRHERIGAFHPIQHYYTGVLGEQICKPIEQHKLEWLPVSHAPERMYVPAQVWAAQTCYRALLKSGTQAVPAGSAKKDTND